MLGAVGLVGLAAGLKHTFVSTQAHSTTHVSDRLLLLHDVDDVVGRLYIHLAAVGIGIPQYVTSKLNGDALHAQTDTEGGYIVGTGIFDGYKLAGNTSLAKSGTYQHTGHPLQLLGYILLCQLLAIDKVHLHLAVVVGTCLREGFADGFVGILQVVLTHQGNVEWRSAFCLVAAFQEGTPRAKSRSVAYWKIHFAQDGGVELLSLHQDGYFVDSGGINALYYSLFIHVAE